MKGTKTPSTAFCLLFKLFTLRLTERQLLSMIDKDKNPYISSISAVGVFLSDDQVCARTRGDLSSFYVHPSKYVAMV